MLRKSDNWVKFSKVSGINLAKVSRGLGMEEEESILDIGNRMCKVVFEVLEES